MTSLQNPDEFWNTFDSRKAALMQQSPSPMQRFPSNAVEGVAGNDMGFWGYSLDLARAIPRGVWGMADSISQGLYYGTGGLIGNDEREAPFGVEYWRGHSQTLPGSVLETVSQLVVPYGGATKAVGAATRITGIAGRGAAATAALGEEAVIAAAAGQRARSVGLAMAGRTLELGRAGMSAVAAGAIADTIAFESHAGRLSNLLTTFDNPLLNNAVTQYLAADEDDSFLEGKLKNAIEGGMFSGALEAIVGSVRVVRSGLRASRIGQDPNAAAFAEHMKMRREHREQIMGALDVDADSAEVINALIDATGMSRSNLSFVRSAEEAVDEMGAPRRAAVTFKEDGETVIKFFKSADRSSPVHEVSHVVRRRLLDRTIDPRHRFGVTDLDIKIIEDFVGVREGIWDVKAEENWAYLYERYTWDGVAPNRKVAAVMSRVSDFMRAVYTNVEAENLLRQANPDEYARRGGNAAAIEINPEVRRVMDKLMSRGPVTTDDAIRVFTKANKKIALAGDGRMYRMLSSMMDRPFQGAEARQAFDDVYSEPTLYQSKKAKAMGAEVTDTAYPVKRGRDAVLDRVRREVQQGDLSRADGEAMEKLIQNLPEEVLETMGVRFRKARNLGKTELGGVILGSYNRSLNIVSMASDWVRNGKVQTTWSHEWVHAITSFLPDETLNALRADYTRAYQRFIRLEGIDPRAQPGTPEFAKLREWASKNNDRFEELYSLTNLDEFLAVGLQSKLWKQLDIQEGTRSFIGYARYALHNMMTSIKAAYGEGTFDNIARELMDADYRMAKSRRDAMLKVLGLKKLVRKDILQPEARSLTGESWMTRLQRDLDQRNTWMFKDFESANLARSTGEAKAEYLPYRVSNKMDLTAEQRTFAGQEPPKQPTQTTTLYQSAFQGQGAPLPQPQRQPLGGQPPQRPFNIANTSTAQDVRNFIDIRVQELEVDGRVQVNSMTREEMVRAGELELAQISDFTGYRTLPQLTAALQNDQDALQQFITRHLAMRNVLSETGQDLIRARDAMLQSQADADIARFVALQQRYDVILEHTKQNQAIIGRGLGAQSIIPGTGSANIRLIDESMLNDPAMVSDIVETAGGRDAVMAMARVSQAAEARGGIAGAARATQGGRHGFMPVLTEYWMNSILSGPITFATNVTSNIATMLYLPAEQAMGAALTRNFPLARESFMRYGAMLHEIRDAMHYAGVTLRTGNNILDVVGANAMTGQATQRGRAISAAGVGAAENSRTGAFVNFIGTVVNAPSSALQATDEFFKQMSYRSTVRARLTADAINEVAQGRLARDQMGAWVEQRFNRLVDQGQMYSQRKIRADANNAARREIDAGTFTENSADHLAFVRDYIRREWDPRMGALAERARDIAREATFTNPIRPNAPGLEGISGKIQNMVNQHPTMRMLIPFVRTPTNIALFFGQRLPFNGVMYQVPGLRNISTRFARDMASNDPVLRAAAAGRMAGGSIITVSALAMAATGTITGSGPKDPEERAYLMKAGWQPYSVKVGNTYISYKKLDPFATFFGMAADLHEAYLRADEEDRSFIETTMYGLATALGNNIANKTYLTGIVSLSNAISDADRNGQAYVNQLFASFIPSLAAQSNELFFEDTAMRDVQTLMDAVKARIPGMASDVAPRRDVLGEVMRKPDRMGLLPPAWPFSYSTAKRSAIIENELAQLGAGFTPPRAMRNDVDMRQYVNRRGRNSYDRWQELTGKVRIGGRTLRESMEQMIESPGYQQLDNTSAPGYESPRIGILRKMISEYRDAALRETLQEFPDLMEAERNRRATVIGARSGKPFADLLQYSRGR